MARKSWSNLLLLLAAIDLAIAIVANHPLRLACLFMFPMLIFPAMHLRRPMI